MLSTFAGNQHLSHEDMDIRYGGVRADNRAITKHVSETLQFSLLAP